MRTHMRAQLCEKDYARARAVNVPEALVAALEPHKAGSGAEPQLIHVTHCPTPPR